MDESKNTKISVPAVIVLYDFQYTAKDKREISVRKGEKLFLIEKTNKDWWQVVRQSERRSFYVPAQYVEAIPKEKLPLEHLGLTSVNRCKDKTDYENLNPPNVNRHRDGGTPAGRQNSIDPKIRLETEAAKSAQVNKQKPVPKTRTKVSTSKVSHDGSSGARCGGGVDPADGETWDGRHDRTHYGDKKGQEMSLSLPKNSEQLTNLLDGSAAKGVGESEQTNHLAKGGRSVPKPRSRICSNPGEMDQSDSSKNRMRSSYYLRVKPSKSFEAHQKAPIKFRKKESAPPLKNDNRNLSRSLERLAQEIKFQPKEVEQHGGTVPTLSHHSESDEPCSKVELKPRVAPTPTGTSAHSASNNAEKREKVQKDDLTQSKGSVFTRLRRSLHHSSSFKSSSSKKLSKSNNRGCELSLSWEGGLDKALELEKNKKPQLTPSGLQRSRTFMVAERSPTALRHAGSIYRGRNRLDIAYHSQKPPEMKNVLSTFKPIGKIDEVRSSDARLRQHSNEARTSPLTGKRVESREVAVEEEDRIVTRDGKSRTTDDDDYSNVYENVAIWEGETKSPPPVASGEAYSHSESEDNSESKRSASAAAQNESSRTRGSVDSNMTHSEGTELSESDENGSVELDAKYRVREPLNKRRTSLMRNRRVSTAKSRTVTARQLPPTPTPEEKSTRDLGNGWGVYVFDDKRNYYYNKITGERSWKPPRKNLSHQDSRYVGSRESICSDTSGSVIRSSTSSPSNDRVLTNSLNRSNASLSSRSTGCDNPGYDLTKSSSGCNLREEIIHNRSSLTSSPATGQSRSSSYSVIKSSRDSLNRCSPIENIPSEEDDLELHDHVYKENVKGGSRGELSGAASEEEPKPRMGMRKEDLLDDEDDEDDDNDDEEEKLTTGVPIPPGWTEHYDETTSQFYYVHKQTNQKWFTSFDPEGRLYFFDELSNESSWALPDISSEGGDANYLIQRSATESAIPKGHSEILATDADKRRHRLSSGRSSKTQSMVIEPKLDFSNKEDGKTLSMPRDLTKMYGEIIRSGMLNKTKICENGKKLRKNWTPAFVVLSNTKLLFFKDAKTFHSMKPANDCMCLNLQGAVIEKGDKVSSKKNVYKVNSLDHTDVLIQTDRTVDAEEWFKDISTVIKNLPQESIDSSTSSLDPNSPSKVGRTKSIKARSKDSGSMEDLSLNPEERQNKIKARLKKFFNRRPTVDSLKKKGIWKDEPVFGCSLEQITKNRTPRVPVFVEKCIESIESKEENLKTDGLYRASGNLSQVQKIRLEVDQNNLNILKEEEDVHVLTGSLKLFFRELKDPLIPFKQLVPALTAINNPKRKEKIREYRKIVGSLPGPNYDTLKFLLQHLLRVEKYNEFNRMNVNNLAIVFGPTLMWPEQESTNMALDFMQQNLVIECLLREFQEIFT